VRDAALGFLAPIFYVSAGFMVSFSALRNPLLVTTVIVVSLLGKFLGGLVFSMLAGRKWREAAVIGVGMNARGSIDIIVAGVALQKGIISRDLYTALILSMFLANVAVPVLLRAGRDWLDRRGELARVATEPEGEAPKGAAPATA